MSSLRSLARLLRGVVIVALFAPAAAHAISMDKASTIRDQCEISIGPDLIGVVSYMPDRSRDRFCGDFPSTGRIILTVDLIAERLRQLPIEVRIVREKNGPISLEEDPTPFTVAYVAPRLYPGGAVPVEHVFEESGAYAALITVTENSGTKRTTRFAINVGGPLQFYATALLSGVFIFGAAFLYWRYTEEKKQRDRSSRAFRPT
ncbi:hypothetical protein OGR47_12565 [Methylocystis sp. MJC1]|jgi:cbb3-type cytochrome oxidase subunit 3|uniref:hypothetical protein n=1 Tax=Methylocystis sp. MJC1 TaxID=2654282 RepID=UPI0013EB931E|nr:hypothetical protein [Methylocystis sp. MJC1]KAF2990920.1 hypothetical protein MJC1_02018 [Methylocystis sp. MJC1]MBU6527814.1 hypothetical protein [Methylocystis sp. MJC1]UZX10740.1 hypothetical protein OGR47_12565 [Methylocystis sp. MJC1]